MYLAEAIEILFTAHEGFALCHRRNCTGRAGDPAFDAFYITQVLHSDKVISEVNSDAAYESLVAYLNLEVYLITENQAGAYGLRGWRWKIVVLAGRGRGVLQGGRALLNRTQ